MIYDMICDMGPANWPFAFESNLKSNRALCYQIRIESRIESALNTSEHVPRWSDGTGIKSGVQ